MCGGHDVEGRKKLWLQQPQEIQKVKIAIQRKMQEEIIHIFTKLYTLIGDDPKIIQYQLMVHEINDLDIMNSISEFTVQFRQIFHP